MRIPIAVAVILLSAQAIAAQAPRPSNAEIMFRLANPCPATGQVQGTCTGYVVDRVIPIVCGGAEDPSNMQWQTLAEAKEKDRWEKIGCRKGRKLVLPTESTSITESFATGELPGGVQAQSLPAGGSAPREIPAAPTPATQSEPEDEPTPP